MKNIAILALCLWSTFALAQVTTIETVVQTGHYEDIQALAYTPDGHYLLSASQDMTVKLWEIETGREIRTFMGPERSVKRISVHPSGKKMLTISEDGFVWVWNIATGALIKKFADENDVITNAIYSMDGKWIISGGSEKSGAIWDSESFARIATLEGVGLGCGTGQCYVHLSTSSDGKWLLAGVQNYQVEYWNLHDFSLDRTIKVRNGSCSTCTAMAVPFPRTKQMITSSGDSLQLRSFNSGSREPFSSIVEDVDVLKISSDGEVIGSLERGTLDVLSKTGTALYQLGKYPNGVSAFAFSPDAKYLVTANEKRQITIRELITGEEISHFQGYLSDLTDSLPSGVRYWVKNLKKQHLSPDGKYVLENIGTHAVLWELNSGRVVRKFSSEHIVVASTFSHSGEYVATAGADRLVSIWNAHTGEPVRTLVGQTATIFSIDFSADDRYILSGGWDYTMRIWDIETGEIYGRYQPHDQGSPVDVHFAPGGIYLISGGLDQKLWLTDIDTGTPVREFIGHTSHVVSIDFSPDGKQMLTGSWDSNAKLWDLSTGLATVRFANHTGPVYDVAFNSTGSMIATGSWDKTAKVWRSDGSLLFDFHAGGGAVISVNFSNDDRYLITGSRDGTTRIWDLETGAETFSHILLSENDWLVKSPSGDFYATEKAMQTVYFVEGMKTYDMDRFFDQFYNPDVITDAQKAQGKAQNQLINSLKKNPPPEVEIISPSGYVATEDAEIEMVFKVINTGGGVDEVKITHNGKTLERPTSEDVKKTKKGRALYETVQVTLVPGHNELGVSAFSSERIESKKRTVEVSLLGAQEKPTCYVLAIGINEYSNSGLNLNYAKTDASGFSKMIRQKSKDLFNDIKITTLYDEEASKENIFSSIAAIASEASPQDVFFMYYAGHGSLVEDQFYFIPTEVVRLYEPDILATSAISADEMQASLKNIQALKQMIVLDACHSGSSTELLASRGSSEEKALAQLSRSAGVHVLAAAGSEQTATEFQALGHGLFTYLLLEALSGTADGSPKDGKVTVYELRSYIDALVPEYSLEYKGAPQYPNTFSRGSDFPIVILTR